MNDSTIEAEIRQALSELAENESSEVRVVAHSLAVSEAFSRYGKGYVTPVGENKRPVLSGWNKENRGTIADPEHLTDLFSAPGTLYTGLQTGRDNGIIVIDLDEGDNKHGIADWEHLCNVKGGVDTFTVETPSGGRHIYFRYPEIIDDDHYLPTVARISYDGKKLAIDLRADRNGYVMAPETTTPKGTYRVIQDVELAPCPAWLLSLVPSRLFSVKAEKSEAESRWPVPYEGLREECSFVSYAVAQPEELSRDAWLAALSLVGRTDGGRNSCHEISSGHSEYDKSETDQAIDQVISSMSPRSCEWIGQHHDCSGCQHLDHVRTPLHIFKPKQDSLDNLQPTLPEGYQLIGNILFHVDIKVDKQGNEIPKSTPVHNGAITIIERRHNITSGEYSLVLQVEKNKPITVHRAEVMDNRAIVSLANKGVNVTSSTAKPLTEYCASYEWHNKKVIPTTQSSGQMGWITPKKFLLGNRCIGDETITYDTLEDDGGYIDALRPKGELDKWMTVYRIMARFPLVQFFVDCSLCAPLLSIVRVDSFLAELAGATSQGKTVALRLAASVWGKPAIPGFISTWDNTSYFVSRMAAMLRHLPLMLDETKTVKNRNDLPQYIYRINSGKVRGQGSPTGVRPMLTWQTVCLTTGEYPVTEAGTGDSGTHARVLSLDELPFGERSPKTGKVIDTLLRTVDANYGVAGEAFIRQLIGIDHDELRERYKECRKELRRQAEEKGEYDAVFDRQLKNLAAVELAGRLFYEWFGTGVRTSPVLAVMDILRKNVTKADRTTEALREMIDFIYSHQSHFYNEHREGYTSNEEYGIWNDQKWRFREVAMYTQKVDSLLEAWGYSPQVTLKEWKKRGLLYCDKERTTKKVAVGSTRIRMVVFNQKAIEYLGYEPNPDEDEMEVRDKATEIYENALRRKRERERKEAEEKRDAEELESPIIEGLSSAEVIPHEHEDDVGDANAALQNIPKHSKPDDKKGEPASDSGITMDNLYDYLIPEKQDADISDEELNLDDYEADMLLQEIEEMNDSPRDPPS